MMTKALAIRIAASSILIGAAMAAGTASADQPRSTAQSSSGDSKAAARAAASAEKALAKHDAARAVADAEIAVAQVPHDAGHRSLLGQSYLEAGRFASAETSFDDALTLDPAQPRAALSLALAQIALGNPDGAKTTLGTYSTLIPPTDRGLALALAGDPAAAIDLLEWAVRSGEADAKTRQNLALSYALSGRWVEAKLMASYDLSPADVTQRIMQWAQFAQPGAAATQVASLLGVTPSEDPGQPVRLALAPTASPERLAEAAPPPPEPMASVAAAFTQVAEAEPEPTPAFDEAPTTVTTFAGIQFAPAAEIVQPLPRGLEPAPLQVAKASRIIAPAARPARVVAASFMPETPRADGKYVVQLGAFSSASRVEVAWDKAIGRFGDLGGYTPSSTTYRMNNATLYRLSLSGFETRREASALCERIKARGGACFVRAVAGDAPLQWAARGHQRTAGR